jgi:hypothetical protein
MQEMVQLAQSQSQQPDTPPQAVSFMIRTESDSEDKQVVLTAGPSHFGRELRDTDEVSLVTCVEY